MEQVKTVCLEMSESEALVLLLSLRTHLKQLVELIGRGEGGEKHIKDLSVLMGFAGRFGVTAHEVGLLHINTLDELDYENERKENT
jgi:hypothetical protein